MSTSQEESIFSELAAGYSGPPISEAVRTYFQTRSRNRLFDYILGRFVQEQERGLTQAKLARRIGKPPEMINRWLGAPSNLSNDSISDLLLGICAEELMPQSESLTVDLFSHDELVSVPVAGSPVGAGSPPGQSTVQFYGRADGSCDMEFWFAGVQARIPVDSLNDVAVAIGLDAEVCLSPLNCASAVEPILKVLVDHGWILYPPAVSKTPLGS